MLAILFLRRRPCRNGREKLCSSAVRHIWAEVDMHSGEGEPAGDVHEALRDETRGKHQWQSLFNDCLPATVDSDIMQVLYWKGLNLILFSLRSKSACGNGEDKASDLALVEEYYYGGKRIAFGVDVQVISGIVGAHQWKAIQLVPASLCRTYNVIKNSSLLQLFITCATSRSMSS